MPSTDLKTILNDIVQKFEDIGSLTSAIQGTLISKGLLSEADVSAALPKVRKAYQDQLAGLHFLISSLPDEQSH